MKIQSKDQFIIWSMALYFGWILSFPYYGAVLQAFAYRIDLYLVYLTPAFLFFHALGYLTGGLFLKKIARWRQLMLGSLILTLTTIAIMWFLPYERWPIALALIGFLSSFYVLGWSCLFSAYTSSEKIRLIAHFVIRANLIVMLIISLSFFLTARAMFVAATVPLIAAWIYFIIARPETVFALPPRLKTKRVFPGVNLLIICLFIIAVKITAGLMFSVIHVSYPVMAEHRLLQTYYNFIPYLLTFFGILLFIRKIKLDSMAFAGVLLLGLAFISFALLKNTIPGFIVTITIIEIAFALFSVWIWVLLGDLSFIYSAPYRF
ncbi:MAG TPA: hypothetical protein VLH18_07180, partial [Candidatus Limnocylindrales bacterium]|nr:hypothetical protein [Candidatus Limnocylindrales bacterium]